MEYDLIKKHEWTRIPASSRSLEPPPPASYATHAHTVRHHARHWHREETHEIIIAYRCSFAQRLPVWANSNGATRLGLSLPEAWATEPVRRTIIAARSSDRRRLFVGDLVSGGDREKKQANERFARIIRRRDIKHCTARCSRETRAFARRRNTRMT